MKKESSARIRHSWPAFAALAAAILFWAGVPLLLKVFTHRLDAWTVNGVRYVFAALFWLPLVLRHRRDVFMSPLAYEPGGGRRVLWRDALVPAVAHVVGQALFGLLPYFNDATVINFVSRSGFLFTTLFGFSMLPDERPLARRPLFWVGFAGTVAGLITMYKGSLGTATTSAAGMGLLVLTAAFWGLYSVLVRKCMRGYPIRLGFGLISLYAVPVLLALMFLFGDWRALLHLRLGWWILLWISAVAGISLGHVLFYRAIHTLGPITSEGSLLAIPFVTVLLASFFLDERLRLLQWIGGLLLIGGCLFLILAKAQVTRDKQDDNPLFSTTD